MRANNEDEGSWSSDNADPRQIRHVANRRSVRTERRALSSLTSPTRRHSDEISNQQWREFQTAHPRAYSTLVGFMTPQPPDRNFPQRPSRRATIGMIEYSNVNNDTNTPPGGTSPPDPNAGGSGPTTSNTAQTTSGATSTSTSTGIVVSSAVSNNPNIPTSNIALTSSGTSNTQTTSAPIVLSTQSITTLNAKTLPTWVQKMFATTQAPTRRASASAGLGASSVSLFPKLLTNTTTASNIVIPTLFGTTNVTSTIGNIVTSQFSQPTSNLPPELLFNQYTGQMVNKATGLPLTQEEITIYKDYSRPCPSDKETLRDIVGPREANLAEWASTIEGGLRLGGWGPPYHSHTKRKVLQMLYRLLAPDYKSALQTKTSIKKFLQFMKTVEPAQRSIEDAFHKKHGLMVKPSIGYKVLLDKAKQQLHWTPNMGEEIVSRIAWLGLKEQLPEYLRYHHILGQHPVEPGPGCLEALDYSWHLHQQDDVNVPTFNRIYGITPNNQNANNTTSSSKDKKSSDDTETDKLRKIESKLDSLTQKVSNVNTANNFSNRNRNGNRNFQNANSNFGQNRNYNQNRNFSQNRNFNQQNRNQQNSQSNNQNRQGNFRNNNQNRNNRNNRSNSRNGRRLFTRTELPLTVPPFLSY